MPGDFDFPNTLVSQTNTTGMVTVDPWEPGIATQATWHVCSCSTPRKMSLAELMQELKERLMQEKSDRDAAKELIAALKDFTK